MTEKKNPTYRISEVARLLGISAEWLRAGERRGFFPSARRDRNGHRYFTQEDVERLRNRRSRSETGKSARAVEPARGRGRETRSSRSGR